MNKVLRWGLYIIVFLYVYNACSSKKDDEKVSTEKNISALSKYKEEKARKEVKDTRGPAWIDGTRSYKGYMDNGMGGKMYVNVAFVINRTNQTVTTVDNMGSADYAYYEVHGDHLTYNQTFILLDEASRRLKLGEGMYLHKR